MITCSVCGIKNDDLSIVCSSCKSFLQGRVDALNLFETMWGLIESPRATFKRIVLAKYKNYSLFLSALFGVCLLLDVAWFKSVGQRFPSLLMIIGAAVVVGPVIGVIFVWLASVVLMRVTRLFGGKAARKNLFAAIAYATFPKVLYLILIVPIELAVFGIDFFGTNPPPSIIKPTEYMLLMGFKGIAVLMTLFLTIEGTMAANAFPRKKFVPVALSVIVLLVLFGAVLYFAKF